jgi:hypothetical protein
MPKKSLKAFETKFQNLSVWINYNVQKFNDQNRFKLFDFFIIDIWNLFVICYLVLEFIICLTLWTSTNYSPSSTISIHFPDFRAFISLSYIASQ